MKKYIDDVEERYSICVRVKRGLHDTSMLSGMFKDQVTFSLIHFLYLFQIYFKGAIELLLNRKNIDFRLLYAGKLTLKDAYRMDS